MSSAAPDESRVDGARGRSRFTWLVAAAAVLLIVGVLSYVLTRGGPDVSTPTAQDTTSASASAGDAGVGATRTVTELSVPADTTAGGRCMVPAEAPQVVAGQDTVVDGTVRSISGSAVVLAPTRFYRGDPTDVVVVQAPGPEMEALLSAVRFEEGRRYLVAASHGEVTLCGFSAEYSDSLAALYAEASPR